MILHYGLDLFLFFKTLIIQITNNAGFGNSGNLRERSGFFAFLYVLDNSLKLYLVKMPALAFLPFTIHH